MKAYRVYYKVYKYDYVVVWGESEDDAWENAWPEVRFQGDEAEITEIEEA